MVGMAVGMVVGSLSHRIIGSKCTRKCRDGRKCRGKTCREGVCICKVMENNDNGRRHHFTMGIMEAAGAVAVPIREL